MAEHDHSDHNRTDHGKIPLPNRRKGELETCWNFKINRVVSTHPSHDISRSFHYKAIALTNLGVIHPSDDEDNLQRAQDCVFLTSYNAYCCQVLLGPNRDHWHLFVVVRFPYVGDASPKDKYFQYRGVIRDIGKDKAGSCEQLLQEPGVVEFCETGDFSTVSHNGIIHGNT